MAIKKIFCCIFPWLRRSSRNSESIVSEDVAEFYQSDIISELREDNVLISNESSNELPANDQQQQPIDQITILKCQEQTSNEKLIQMHLELKLLKEKLKDATEQLHSAAQHLIMLKQVQTSFESREQNDETIIIDNSNEPVPIKIDQSSEEDEFLPCQQQPLIAQSESILLADPDIALEHIEELYNLAQSKMIIMEQKHQNSALSPAVEQCLFNTDILQLNTIDKDEILDDTAMDGASSLHKYGGDKDYYLLMVDEILETLIASSQLPENQTIEENQISGENQSSPVDKY